MDLNLSVPAQNLFVSTSGTNLSLSVPQQISLTPDSQATQALSLSVHDQTLGVIYVAGKQGDKGDQGPPGPRGSGISSLNGLTGDVNIYGTGGNLFVITVTPNRIYISGSGLVNSGDLLALSGYLSNQIAASGSTLYSLITGVSGYATSSAALSGYVTGQLAALSGYVVQQDSTLSGRIESTGQTLYNLYTGISGGNAVALSGYVTGQIAALSGYVNQQDSTLSGQTSSTGSALYALITGLSGQAQYDYATKLSLYQTGSYLYVLITGVSGDLNTEISSLSGQVSGQNSALSGLVTGISGVLNDAIIATGNSVVAHSNGIGTNLSGTIAQTGSSLYQIVTGLSGQALIDYATKTQLTQTGVSLGNKIDVLSGFATGVSGYLQDQINALPTTATVQSTGQQLYTLLTGLSGQAQTDYATKVQLTQTGVNLGAQINSLSGFTTGISGALQTLIDQANADVNSINGQSGTLTISGTGTVAVISGGQGLILVSGRETDLSGYITTGNADARYYPLSTNPSGFITTGQTGQFYPASNPAQYATSGNLASTGSNLYVLVTGMSGQAQIDYATKTQLTQSGVDLGNRISSLSGYTNNQDYLTGRAAVLYASGISGGLEIRITATGNATIAHANSIGSTISGNVTQTGVTLLNFIVGGDTNLSGNLTQTGITLNNRINSLSGYGEGIYVHRTGYELISGQKQFVSSLILTGIQFLGQSGSGIYLNVSQDGTVVFAGPSGSTATIGSGISGSIFAVTDQFEAPMLDIYSDGRILLGQYLANTMMVSGSGVSIGVSYIPANYRFLISGDWQYIGNVFSGQSNIVDLFYPRQGNPSGYITGLPGTGNLATLNQLNSLSGFTTGISGALQTIINATGISAINHANGVGANLSGNLTQTGITLNGRINSLSGYVDNQDYATGRAAILYASGISGVLNAAIIATGNAAVAHANGVGVNLSGNLAQTGATLIARDNSISGVLQGYIDSISAGTGIILRDVVYTSGIQFISGTKYFIGNTYIDNLYVTGKQFVVNTQDIYVGNNWMVLNATGGARDSAIFVSTGFTGINATGGVIGFDVPSNTWRFGLGGYLTDLASLPSIASVTDIVNASGGLEARIVQTGAAAVAYANTIGLNLSGVLIQTGATLISLNLATSGALTGRLYQTGLDLYNQIYNTGQIILSVSGGLEARITATGNSAINHANGIGQTISGNLTQTGVTLGAQIAALSGFVTGFNGGVVSYLTGLLPTGYSEYYIWHPVLFPTIPRVNVTMELSGDANGMYGVSISGRSTSGFYALLTDSVDTSGVFLDVIAKI